MKHILNRNTLHNYHHAVGHHAKKTASISVALHLSFCCESDVHESVYVSQLHVSLDNILELESRAPSLSVTRRQLIEENLLW